MKARLQACFVLWLSCVLSTSVYGATNVVAPRTFFPAMRDGVELATDVFLPTNGSSFPVILARTPYHRTGVGSAANDAVRRGFAFVVQDVRGRYESKGENLPFDRDHLDGPDTLEWVLKQSWCNGHVGTWGGSAGAITQIQLASAGVRGLDAMHLVVGAPRQYHDLAYTGGVFRKSLVEDWIRATRFQSNALQRWVSHPLYDGYWKERDAGLTYRRVNTPAIHIGGYWDIFAQGTIDTFLGYQTKGGPKARGQQKLLMGPWTHGVLQEKAGSLKFPMANKPPGQVQDPWRWYAHWLKGETNHVEDLPAVTYYVVGDVSDTNAPGNVWRTASTWPPVPTTRTAWYFHLDHAFTSTAPTDSKSPPLEYAYDPTTPAPTVGGIQLTIPAGPMDQKDRESRADVLVFSSDVLKEPVEVTGQVTARLYVSSDAPDTDFFVTLCDVYPDGRSFNLCEGRLRARFRDGFDREHRLQKGKIYRLDLDLWATSVIFNRGHRIRADVSSSSAPGFDPNPNTGEPFRSSSKTQIAHNQIFMDSAHPSCVFLPVASAPSALSSVSH